MTELHLSESEGRAIRHALMDLPKVCQYHGARLVREEGFFAGQPCCDTGAVPFRAKLAWEALTAALDRHDDATQRAVEEARPHDGEAAVCSNCGHPASDHAKDRSGCLKQIEIVYDGADQACPCTSSEVSRG